MDGITQVGGENPLLAPVFSGVYTHALDPKKRLTIPAEWRAWVGQPERVFIMPGFGDEPCLHAFPMRVMAARLAASAKRMVSDPRYRLFTRILGENSADLPWDSQGRIRIPDHLLNKVGLTGDVYMVGAQDRFELWKPENRQLYQSEKETGLSIGSFSEEMGF